jgi:hypothetical protein
MDLRDSIMAILNGRLQGDSCDLNKIEAERHRNLINIVDKIWDEKGLKGRDGRNCK